VALTPTWNESAYFADYILPMGHGPERHDTHSYEQYDGQWIAFRQPVLRAARERLGEAITDSRQVNPGEVWEENERSHPGRVRCTSRRSRPGNSRTPT
jgi:hypothetical protein